MELIKLPECWLTYETAKFQHNSNCEKFDPMLCYFECVVKQLNDEESEKLSREILGVLKRFSASFNRVIH